MGALGDGQMSQMSQNKIAWGMGQRAEGEERRGGTRCRLQGAGYKVQVTRCRLQGASYRLPGTRYKAQGAGVSHFNNP